MSIVVTKCSPELVGPSESGTPTGDIHISRFDEGVGSGAVSSLLVFDKPIVDPVATIRRALSGALVQYYPVPGRHAAGAARGEVIRCAGEGQGVLFVGASTNCAVGDVLISTPATRHDLLVHYPEGFWCRDVDPLLLMQVTAFSCGGFVVGVSWNHVLADGAGIGQFLQAVAELAGGVSLPSIVPVRSDESVMAAHPEGITLDDVGAAEHTKDMAFVDFTVPSSFISRVKELCGCTVFEAVVALVWHCRARALPDVDPESSVSLAVACNMRGLVGAAGGYYGNCLVMDSVAATSAEVANSDIKDVVKLIKIAKHKIQSSGEPAERRHRLGYNTLAVSSWRNIGLEVPDFGSGRPVRVIWYAPKAFTPVFVLCPPWRGNNGVNVMGYIVKKEHLDAFMQEIAAKVGT
ncbi:unnamed protein product [Alopecurus aequalis]